MSDRSQLMPDPSRRRALQMIAAGGVASLFARPGPARAAAQDEQPSTTSTNSGAMQGGGFYRFKVGDTECAVVSDGGFPGRLSDLFPKVGDDELAEAADKAFLAPGFYPMTVSALLVRLPDATVLIDTGAGNLFGPGTGKLVANLERAGVKPDEITHVIISHAHSDHIGGLVTAEGKSQFPRARIIMSEPEHAFWTSASPKLPDNTLLKPEMLQAMLPSVQKILGAVKGQLDLKKPGDVIAGKLTLVDAAGHTPGMIAVRLDAEDDGLLFVGDTMHVIPLQAPHPEWKILFDADPEAGAKTRQRIMSEVASNRTLITGPHLSFPALGHLAKDGDAFRWVPRTWQW